MPFPPSARRASAAVLAVALAASASVLAATPSFAAPAGCTVSQVDVVAHPDDDLLFQSPDLIDAINAPGTCVTTAYLTVGDAGKGATYWQSRLSGVEAAYAQMAGVANTWTAGTASLAGRTVRTMTLAAKPTVALVFFGLPDGGYDGTGFPVNGSEGLRKLDEGTIPAIHAIDGSGASYTKDELTASLTALMVQFQATTVHAQDTTIPYDRTWPDHPDHVAAARLTQAASTAYLTPHTLVSYVDYDTNSLAHNLTDAQIAAKKAAFYTYASYDSDSCASDAYCVGRDEVNWLQTQYVAARTDVNFPAPVVTPAPVATQTVPAPAPAPVPSQTATTPVVPTAPVVPTLPGEQGTPKAVLADATLTTKQFLTRGVTATFTGLTAGKQYQLAYVAGESGTAIGAPVTAGANGTVSGTWKPRTSASPALAAPGRFALRLTGVETTVNLAKSFVVKSGSTLSWKSAHRTGKKVVLTVTARTATASGTVAWKHADVLFQKRVGSAWKTVAVDETSSKGVATRTVKAGAAKWRAVVASTGTVWSATSRTVSK